MEPLDASAAAVLQQVEALNAQLDSMHAMPNQIDFEAEDILSVSISSRVECVDTIRVKVRVKAFFL